MDEIMIRNYAQLALARGVNLQKGQLLVVDTQLCAMDFVHVLTEEAYRLGAKDVVVHIDDPVAERLRLLYADDETITEIPNWMTESQTYYADKNACFLRVHSADPDAMQGVPAERIAARQKAISAPLVQMKQRRMANEVSWSVVAVPNGKWAKRVYPQLEEAQAVEALWEAICRCCYVTRESGVAGWDAHVDAMQRRVAELNALDLRTLHFVNGKGTDLTLSLCEEGVFAGGICHCPEPDGIVFAPNIPTEEILTTPHRFSANGVVYNTLPLVYGGSLIDGFRLTFTDGVVTDWDCAQGRDVLAGILATDEGSRRLGEVALVPYDSPINRTGVLFFNTLFDENASCHLALGAGYVDVLHGADRSTEALVRQGLNLSMLHVDFMFGSADMRCTGTTADGREITIFKDGLFAL